MDGVLLRKKKMMIYCQDLTSIQYGIIQTIIYYHSQNTPSKGLVKKDQMKRKINMKKDVKSLADLSEAKRLRAIEYYSHIARAMMLCQSALHSLDDVSDNMFHKHEIKRTINQFINGVERFATTFVENNNETMAQTYSNIIKQIDEFKENIKVQIQ